MLKREQAGAQSGRIGDARKFKNELSVTFADSLKAALSLQSQDLLKAIRSRPSP